MIIYIVEVHKDRDHWYDMISSDLDKASFRARMIDKEAKEDRSGRVASIVRRELVE